jgi:hypothetical protein
VKPENRFRADRVIRDALLEEKRELLQLTITFLKIYYFINNFEKLKSVEGSSFTGSRRTNNEG